MPSEVVTSPVPRKPHHPSCISSKTHQMLCVPMSMPDCAAHDPGMGVTCYTRPDWEILGPTSHRLSDPNSNALVCTKHLGEVMAKLWQGSDGKVAVVTRYEGA